jgi:hypothetical protein
VVQEPLDPPKAKRLIRSILREGTLRYTKHALDEMKADGLTAVDCCNVLGGGWVEPGEFENGSWRYRVRTASMCFVVAFRSEQTLVIVTAWRE